MSINRIIKKLPVTFQTETQRKFFESTFDQLFSKKDSKYVNGFIGRRNGGAYDPVNDFYLNQPTSERDNYQLEPIAVSKDSSTLENVNSYFYQDLLNKIKFYGGNTENHDRLFSEGYYSFAPPIDMDKYLNYQNYFWVPDGEFIEIDDDVDVKVDIIGSVNFTSLSGIVFTSGMRIKFTNPNVQTQWDNDPWDELLSEPQDTVSDIIFTVEKVGSAIILVPNQSTLISVDQSQSLPWDETGTLWDSLPWDAIQASLAEDYITIERGSCDLNAWSRTNTWYHKDVLDYIALETSTEFPQQAVQAQRPIIEFIKDLELYNAGEQFNTTVRVASELEFSDIQGEVTVDVDGITLTEDDLLIFLNDGAASILEPWDSTLWDSAGWETSLTSESITSFIWQVKYVAGVIDLIPYPDASSIATDGDVVLIAEGDSYQGSSFFQNNAMWDQVNNEKVKTNQPPLFNLYDTNYINLDDETIYPGSTFAGSEIFSYKVNTESTINDPVLGFPLEYKSLGQASDIVFQHNLETDRETYLIDGEEDPVDIIGYYYFKNQHADTACVFSPELEYTWVPATEKERQRIADRYVVTNDGNDVFTLSANPSDDSIADPLSDHVIVKIDGASTKKIDDWNIAINPITDNAEITTIAGLLADQVIEIFTYTTESLPEGAGGYYEIPNSLEANPNNLEVAEYTVNEFTSHFSSIIENQTGIIGGALGDKNNYRDTEKDLSKGTFILQNEDPLLKIMFSLSDSTVNVIDAIRFASREYTRFKNSFIKKAKQLIDTGFTPFEYGDSIPQQQWLEEIIKELNLTKQYSDAFTYSYMIASGDVFKQEIFALNGTETEHTLVEFEDLTDEKNALYVYVNNELQLIDVDYAVVELNPITINFTTAPANTDVIVTKLYNNPAAARIPATPSKLGMYPVFKPEIITDTNYVNPVEVIVGHDGSRTPLYGDYRDDLLLELEKRIYNGINEKFRIDYDLLLPLAHAKPGFFRDTNYSVSEYNDITKSLFSRWSTQMNADFRINEFVDVSAPTGSFLNSSATWNWSGSEVSDSDLPGNWKGIYLRYYDTLSPQNTPWEMLGFNEKPTWWEPAYGFGPYKSTDSAMWADIEAGYILQGARQGTDLNYARPGLVASYLPVDGAGNILSPSDIGIATTPTLAQKTAAWEYGDVAPVENAWMTSESYPFAVLEILFMTKPAAFSERFWDPANSEKSIAQPEQLISTSTATRQSNFELVVHGETVNNVIQIKSGYQQYITDQILFLGKSIKVEFGDKIRNLDVKLAHKYASFTNENTMRTFAESFSTISQSTSLLIPTENVQVEVHTSPSIEEFVYSGVLVKALANKRYQVYGYDINNLDFNILPRSSDSRVTQVSVAGKSEDFTYFEIGNTYTKNELVSYNSVYYRSVEEQVASTFDLSKWNKLPSLPTSGGISVSYKLDNTGVVERVDYGTIFENEEDVFNFLMSYSDYLTSVGWKFDTVNTDINVLQDWKESAKQFLFWASSNWSPDNFITLSPASQKVVFDAPVGYAMNIERTVNGVYSILDKNGVVIDPANTLVSRYGSILEASHKDETQGIYGLRINVAETEHAIVFDNETIFNDVIYNPLLLSRQQRLEINAIRTANWTGKLEAAGYLVTETGLISNFENITDSIKDYHNVTEIVDNPVIENTARHLIGYENRPYLEALDISDDTQYQFYQGMLLEKGTSGAIQRLLRSEFVRDEQEITTYEEWSLKLSEFGYVCENESIDLRVTAPEVKTNPQLIELVYPSSLTGSVTNVAVTNAVNVYTTVPNIIFIPVNGNVGVVSAEAVAVLTDEGKLDSITLINGGSGYTQDPAVFIDDGTNGANWDILPWDNYPFDAEGNNPDEIIAVITKVIDPDSSLDDKLVIDIDDNERWLTKPRSCTPRETLWPTTALQNYITSNAGYVNPLDVTYKTFSVDTLDELWSESTIVDPAETTTTWIAKSTNEDWNVYRLDDIGVSWNIVDIDDELTYPPEVIVDTEGNINLVIDGGIPTDNNTTTRYIDGKIVVQDTATNESALYNYELIDVDGADYTYSISDVDDVPITSATLINPAKVLQFVSLRFADEVARDASSVVFAEGDYVWIDIINGLWTVQQYVLAEFVMFREQELLIDTINVKNSFLYDKTTSDTLSRMPIYDPFKGLIPGIADQNITYKTHTDPARYTNAATDDLINGSRLFDEDNVGMLWWDQGAYRYMYYEQGTNTERRDNWGKLFPGSEILMYEWVKSSSLPQNYTGDGIVRNTTDYVKKTEYVVDLGEERNVYYFWVLDKTSVPNIKNRTLNSTEVSRLIADPTSQAYQWASPISASGFVFTNVDHLLSDKDSVIQINYKTSDEDIDAHAEWKLVRENDPNSIILNQHWDKMVDSLVGLDRTNLIVPDPHLSEFEKYGANFRPRQSWFKDIFAARKILVQSANAILIDICLYDIDSSWDEGVDTNTYWEYVDWYATGFDATNTTPARQINIIGDLNIIKSSLNDGDIVKVVGTDRYSLYQYSSETDTYTLIMRENCAVQLLDSLYTSTKLISLQTELRQLLNAFRNVVFINDLIVNTNVIFFALLNYVLSEQEDVDWVFKTSYLHLTQEGDELSQERNYTRDSFDSTLDYINEIKPYRTKIRDYTVSKSTPIDLASGTANDDVRNITTKIIYDRVACELSLTEIRAARNIRNFNGYIVLDASEPYDFFNYDVTLFDEGDTYDMRLGNAGRFVTQQLDLLDFIMYVPVPGNGVSYSINDFSETLYPPTTEEEFAAATINQRLFDAHNCDFQGETLEGLNFSENPTIEWDSDLWDSTGFDKDLDLLQIEGTNPAGEFIQLGPNQLFAGASGSNNTPLQTQTSYGPLTIDPDNIAVFVDGDQTTNFYINDNNLVMLDDMSLAIEIEVFEHQIINSAGFIQPNVKEGIPEELAPVSSVENIVFLVDVNRETRQDCYDGIPVLQPCYIISDSNIDESTLVVTVNGLTMTLGVDYQIATAEWDNGLWDAESFDGICVEFINLSPGNVHEESDEICLTYNVLPLLDGGIWDSGPWDAELFDEPVQPAELSFKLHVDVMGHTQYLRNSNDHSAKLAVDLLSDATQIDIVDEGAIGISVNPTQTNPGIIWIGAERIEYYVRVGDTLSDLRRGTNGTSVLESIASDTKLFDGSDIQKIPLPEDFNWVNSNAGLSFSTTVQAEFLRQHQGTFEDL